MIAALQPLWLCEFRDKHLIPLITYISGLLYNASSPAESLPDIKEYVANICHYLTVVKPFGNISVVIVRNLNKFIFIISWWQYQL